MNGEHIMPVLLSQLFSVFLTQTDDSFKVTLAVNVIKTKSLYFYCRKYGVIFINIKAFYGSCCLAKKT